MLHCPIVLLYEANEKAAALFLLTFSSPCITTSQMLLLSSSQSGPAGAVVLVMAHRRIEITETSDSTTFPLTVKVNHITPTPFSSPEFKDKVNTVRASCNEILSTVRDIVKINPLFQQHISYFARKIDVTNPYALADFAASLTSLDANELQEVLETVPLEERLSKALILLKKELQLASLQAEIKADIEKRFHEQNRKYFLNEQLKTIKTELGLEKDDKEALFTKFEDRVAKLDMPATARQVYKEELDKLMSLEKNSSEFNVTSTYLDWLTNIPWGKYSVDNLNITRAREILDAEHFGLSDVKDRIVEFIAMAKLTGTVQGKILCLVGPPGVGKTSIGKSIADALGRKFYRFSVGGLSDVAEIKGHRRTYIGALPGKIIQCFKATGVSNPLVLIDEIDKIGTARGHSGDPSSALLELLDPSQNSSFMDHYLDTPVDVSKVLFICTANSLETLPGPLIDRMEIIRLSGYDFNEKIEIAKKYLDQKIRQEMGLLKGKRFTWTCFYTLFLTLLRIIPSVPSFFLTHFPFFVSADDPATPRSVEITEEALDHLIRGYARESGVRNLEKLMQKIYRKIAVELIAKREKAIPSSFDDDIITSTATSLLEAGVTPPPTEAAKKESISDDKSALADSSKPETRTKKTLSSLTSIVALQDEDAFQRELSPEDATALRQRIAAQYKKEREELQRLIEKKREEEKKAWADLAIEDEQWTVHKDNLQKYVGKPVFTTDRLYALPPAGVIMGLAWTQMGGSALYIEVSSPYLRPSNITEKNKKPAKKQLKGKNKGPIGNDVIQDTYTPPPSGSHDGRDGDDDSKHEPSPYGGREVFDGDAAGDDHDADVSLPTGGSLRLTGKMGEVMQESAQIAYTFARQYLRTVEGHRYNDYLDTIPVHLHIPEGATPKDGPSAGVTMVSALLSLALDKPPRPDVAMTGEIDLKGTVLSVGGIKEKVMAARRAGITTIVIPATNERDYAELPDHFKEDVTIHFAKTYEDVYKVVFDYDQSVVDKEIERQKQHALK